MTKLKRPFSIQVPSSETHRKHIQACISRNLPVVAPALVRDSGTTAMTTPCIASHVPPGPHGYAPGGSGSHGWGKKKRSQRDDSDERVKGKATRDPVGVRCHAALETYRGGVNAVRLSRALADFVGRHWHPCSLLHACMHAPEPHLTEAVKKRDREKKSRGARSHASHDLMAERFSSFRPFLHGCLVQCWGMWMLKIFLNPSYISLHMYSTDFGGLLLTQKFQCMLHAWRRNN